MAWVTSSLELLVEFVGKEIATATFSAWKEWFL